MRWSRRKREADVPALYSYVPLSQRPARNGDPEGTECATRAADPNRAMGEPCNRCGHYACQVGACDICRITVRVRALENP